MNVESLLENFKNNGGSYIDKPWGCEVLIEKNEKYVVKALLMKDGHRCSLQRHNLKHETIVVMAGQLTVEFNGEERLLAPGEKIIIVPGDVHRMASRHGDCVYLEASTPELDDVVRLEDDYNRASK